MSGPGAYAARPTGAYLPQIQYRFTESLSEEVKGAGVNVNAVLPTVIDTPRNRADMPSADPSAWVDPLDLGEVIVFLAAMQRKLFMALWFQ